MAAKHISLFQIFLVIVCLIYGGNGASFRFGVRDDICTLLDIDAVFDLTRQVGNETEVAPQFSIEEANVTSSQSICGTDVIGATLTLILVPSGENLKLNFRRNEGDSTIVMSVVLSIDAKKHFENATGVLPFDLEDSDDLPMGVRNMSYKCISEQQLLFKQDPGYSMTMTISNLQVQAYDVTNDEFSPAMVCEQDLTTTVPAPTTVSEATKEPATGTTTPSKSPQTSVNPETTEPGTPETKVPDMTTSITQSPATGTTTPSTSPQTSVNPETTEPGTPETKVPDMTTSITQSPVTEPTTVSPEPVTTTPKTEPTTTPQLIPKYEITDGTGEVCIVLQGTIDFVINYELTNGENADKVIPLPDIVSYDGHCSDNGTNSTQEFKVIFFGDKWSFSVVITEDSDGLRQPKFLGNVQAEGLSYSWTQIQLMYVLDEHFEDPKDAGQEKTVTKDDGKGDFKASAQGSYRCKSGESLALDETVRMDLGNFQYRAFGTTKDGDFTDKGISACPADSDNDDDDDDDTLAIVLGSVFGGLAFVILVAAGIYVIRKRRKYDYEVM